MSSLITTTYVSLYAVPGTLKSMSIFDRYGVYFWGDFTASTFHIEDIRNSEYIGIGKEVHSNEYMNVSYVRKIRMDKNFQPIYFHFKTQKTNVSCTVLEEGFSKIESDDFKKYKIAEAFQEQIEAFEKENGELKSSTADTWYCIVADKENMIKTLDESTFYKSKHIAPFGINIEDGTTYVPNKMLLNQLHLYHDYYLDISKSIVSNKRTGIKAKLSGLYKVATTDILINIARSDDKTYRMSKSPNENCRRLLERVMEKVAPDYRISYVSEGAGCLFSIVPRSK